MKLSKTKQCFTLLSIFVLLIIFIIYWNHSSNFLKICSTIFTPQQQSQRRKIVIYNRIPKTASTTFTNAIAYDLCQRNGFHVAHLNLTKSRMQMSKIDQFLFAKNITEWMDIQPLFLHGHFSFVDFQSLGFPPPIWINLLREPFERLVSYFYFLRHGDNFRVGLKRSKAGNNETFDECFLNKSKECDPSSVWLQIPFFCGTAHFCTDPGNQQAFNKAKYNLLHNYLLVGTTDRMEQMIKLLEFLLPEYFKNASEHFNSLNEKRKHLRHTTKKILPSLEVENKFKQNSIYKMEREFYDFAVKEFEYVWQQFLSFNKNQKSQFRFEKIRP